MAVTATTATTTTTTGMPTPTDLAALRLLQLCSPALPVGAFAYSEGLESAVHEGWIHDDASAAAWIIGRLRRGPARLEAPVGARLHAAWSAGDHAAIEHWNVTLWAFRESRELREADRDMGQALARLLVSLDVPAAAPWRTRTDATFTTLFMLAAVSWDLPGPAALTGLLWAWLEAQVTAAVKLVPLGQTAGQRLLHAAATEIPALVERALTLDDDDLGALAPGAALAAARHETLDVRLFRS
jgi:urease accessory protein